MSCPCSTARGSDSDYQPHAFERDAIAHGIKDRRRERFDAMRQGIDASRGREMRRQIAGEVGIEND